MRQPSEICKKTPSLLRKKRPAMALDRAKRRNNWCQLVGPVFKIKLGTEDLHRFP